MSGLGMKIEHAAVALSLDRRHLQVMVVTSLLLLASAVSQAVPVWNGKLTPPRSVKGQYCNVAVVRSHRPIVVRAGPGRAFAKIGSVPQGSIIYTCSERADRKVGYDRFWLGIAYKGSGRPCAGAEAQGLPVQVSAQCKTGWVDRDWIETLTG